MLSMKRNKNKKLIFGLSLAAVLAMFVLVLVNVRNEKNAVKVPILMYHSVCNDESLESRYIVSTDTFRKDMDYLKDKAYTSIFVSDLADYVLKGTELPENPIIITFDDGYLNNMTEVLPILEESNMKAVISVVGVTSDNPGIDRQNNIGFSHLNWQELSEMTKTGCIEIANHTYNLHSCEKGGRQGCTKIREESEQAYQEELKKDLSTLNDEINEKCGIISTTFTYPYGKISKESVPVLKELGFTAALTCKFGMNYLEKNEMQLYGLRRFNRPAGISTEIYMRLLGI